MILLAEEECETILEVRSLHSAVLASLSSYISDANDVVSFSQLEKDCCGIVFWPCDIAY